MGPGTVHEGGTAPDESSVTRTILRSGLRGTAMREREPSHQLHGGFVRGCAIERHERRGHAGPPGDLGPPPVGLDRRRLDDIEAPADFLFESLCQRGHGRQPADVGSEPKSTENSTRPARAIKRSDARRCRQHAPRGQDARCGGGEGTLLSVCPHDLHGAVNRFSQEAFRVRLSLELGWL